MNNGINWVGTWTTTPAPSEAKLEFYNQTLRMNPRISIGGESLRVRISNAYGNENLEIGDVCIGVREDGPTIVQESNRKLYFNGDTSAIVAAGSILVSDPVNLKVDPLTDLSVSIYLPGTIPNNFSITGRYARQTNYISPPGNFSAESKMPVGKISDEWFFISGIDVLTSSEVGGIITLGDSLTDGNISTHDTYNRWPDQLARRLVKRSNGPLLSVMNQGLGGNRLLHDFRGDSGLRRFDRDVLAQPGITHTIVMLGTNDLRNRIGKPQQEVTAKQMIFGISQLAQRARAKDIKFIGATLTPFGNETFLPGAWNPVREKHRNEFNNFIRQSDLFDGVADFDEALRDPQIPSQMLANLDCGDGLHPSDLGYCEMGNAIDLAIFN